MVSFNGSASTAGLLCGGLLPYWLADKDGARFDIVTEVAWREGGWVIQQVKHFSRVCEVRSFIQAADSLLAKKPIAIGRH